jgi:hypothetical protein
MDQSASSRRIHAILAHPITYVAMCAALFVLDVKFWRYLLFPIFFAIPVCLAAHYYRRGAAYAIAAVLPWGRYAVAIGIEQSTSHTFLITNALMRTIVFCLLAYFVARAARKTHELEDKVEGLATICAWSRTIEYEGTWISFEEYLQRRFGIRTSHGISPMEAAKLLPAEGERLQGDDGAGLLRPAAASGIET